MEFEFKLYTLSSLMFASTSLVVASVAHDNGIENLLPKVLRCLAHFSFRIYHFLTHLNVQKTSQYHDQQQHIPILSKWARLFLC